jgi:hypothetical protein
MRRTRPPKATDSEPRRPPVGCPRAQGPRIARRWVPRAGWGGPARSGEGRSWRFRLGIRSHARWRCVTVDPTRCVPWLVCAPRVRGSCRRFHDARHIPRPCPFPVVLTVSHQGRAAGASASDGGRRCTPRGGGVHTPRLPATDGQHERVMLAPSQPRANPAACRRGTARGTCTRPCGAWGSAVDDPRSGATDPNGPSVASPSRPNRLCLSRWSARLADGPDNRPVRAISRRYGASQIGQSGPTSPLWAAHTSPGSGATMPPERAIGE